MLESQTSIKKNKSGITKGKQYRPFPLVACNTKYMVVLTYEVGARRS